MTTCPRNVALGGRSLSCKAGARDEAQRWFQYPACSVGDCQEQGIEQERTDRGADHRIVDRTIDDPDLQSKEAENEEELADLSQKRSRTQSDRGWIAEQGDDERSEETFDERDRDQDRQCQWPDFEQSCGIGQESQACEEHDAEHIAERQDAAENLVGEFRFRDDDTSQERTEREGESSPFTADRGTDREEHDTQQKELARAHTRDVEQKGRNDSNAEYRDDDQRRHRDQERSAEREEHFVRIGACKSGNDRDKWYDGDVLRQQDRCGRSRSWLGQRATELHQSKADDRARDRGQLCQEERLRRR